MKLLNKLMVFAFYCATKINFPNAITNTLASLWGLAKKFVNPPNFAVSGNMVCPFKTNLF